MLSIQGAHTSTPPAAGGFANGTESAADPGSLNPSGWDVEDTLWIAVAGIGETSTGGAWGGVTAAPAGYSGYADSGTSADAVGAIEGAVAFLQSAAASADPGTFTNDTSNVRWGALTIAVRPAPPTPTTTGVAKISLAGASTPETRTSHVIQMRARTTAGAGVMRAALYEGANNRSGDLESSALTTSLAPYTLAISDANAANITSYADLEIWLWGYAAGGGAIVFEVAELSLSIPAAPTVYVPRHSAINLQEPGIL